MENTAFNSFTKSSFNKANIDFETANLIEAYFNITALKSKEFHHCYINVMNNKSLSDKDYKDMYIRKNHGYAHITVLNFTKPTDTGYRGFDSREYFYVTKVQNGTDIQIRNDLLVKWTNADSSVFVLAVDTKYNKVAKIPVKMLVARMASAKQVQSENYDFLKVLTIPETDLIWTPVTESCDKEKVYALMAQWKYIGNVKYNTYEARTSVKIISYKNGNKSQVRTFKSIKQAYDMMKLAGFEMSYKTFQRRCNAEKPSLIEMGNFTFYATTKIDFEGPDTI